MWLDGTGLRRGGRREETPREVRDDWCLSERVSSSYRGLQESGLLTDLSSARLPP